MTQIQTDTSFSKPKIFIGSSREGLKVAEKIRAHLANFTDCIVWNDPGFFEVAEITIDSLEKALNDYRYAVIIMSPDDKITIRGQKHATPRDNLIFELGLFVGRHGRRSAFIVAPYGREIRLPSDLLGITRCHYKKTKVGYDVSSACSEIAHVLKSSQQRSLRQVHKPTPTKFWGNLSDKVKIVFGVEYSKNIDFYERYTGDKDHPSVSLRDLETANMISSFINRCYPQKELISIPSTTEGWHKLMQPDEDLIIIGGFATNSTYNKYREICEQHYRVKMGRLCGIDGKRILLPSFDETRTAFTPYGEAQLIEDLPSKDVTLDYGVIISKIIEGDRCLRRVITMAGIKGNGTKGAASILVKNPNPLDTILPNHLKDTDVFEMVVASRVSDNEIHQTEIVEITLNNEKRLTDGGRFWKPCEQEQSCSNCTFGIPEKYLSKDKLVHITPLITTRRKIRAIIFDLDDTLTDTFNLIKALEKTASEEMVKVIKPKIDPSELTKSLLMLRQSNPENIEEMIKKEFPQITGRALKARRAVFSNACRDELLTETLQKLSVDQNAKNMLQQLRQQYSIYLLTIGSRHFQNAKITYLDLYDLFDDVEILSSRSKKTKKDAMAALARKHHHPYKSVVVVGNRLDNEIRAGRRLGMHTIWVCHGEGSAMRLNNRMGQPLETIYDIKYLHTLPDILAKLVY